MAISFESGWDSEFNHTSGRSEEEVTRIIEEIPNLSLGYDHSKGTVAIAIQLSFAIRVKKGIHDDNHGKHITIEVNKQRTWHLYLKKDEYRENTFIWRVDEIR